MSAAGDDTERVVHLDVTATVATITLDSPANRNALSRRLVADLLVALDGAEAAVAAGGVRSIVLSHTPPVFCAGADLKERSSGGTGRSSDSTARRGPGGPADLVAAMSRLMDAPVPTIAAVDGPVRAGGIGLMASCDLVVMRGDLELALTEVRIGVAAAIISVPIFRRAAPSALAAALLTGEPFSAEAARQAGLVTHVADDVGATVERLCAGIALGAPGAVAVTKELLGRAFGADRTARDAEFERMRALSDRLFAGAEAAEGMAAFAARRPPSWPAEPAG